MSMELEWISEFRKAINTLDISSDTFQKNEPSLEEACQALVALGEAKNELALIYTLLSAHVSGMMDAQDEILLEGGHRIEKKMSSDRKGWQHQVLAQTVADRLIQSSVDMDTGEILYSQQEIIAKMLDFLQPSYWRVKELQKIGINADLYCEVGETKTNIIVRKAK